MSSIERKGDSDFDEKQAIRWLRNSKRGRSVVARLAHELICRRCVRIQRMADRCRNCSYRSNGVGAELLDSIPPSNVDAEYALIGSVLLDPSGQRHLVSETPSEDFYLESNRITWEVIRGLVSAGKPVDTTIVADGLSRLGKFDEVGGARYLLNVLHVVGAPSHASYYASIVREKAQLRRAAQAACELLKACYSSSASNVPGSEVRQAALRVLDSLGI